MGNRMTALVINGDTSGSVTLQVPAAAGSGTVHTLPAATGTVMVSGNMPAFSAYQTSNQSVSNASYTKITFTTEEFDTGNCFASSRFTPTVAGYYQLNSQVQWLNAVVGRFLVHIHKNGTYYKRGTDINATNFGGIVSTLAYANGTTDYFEVYVYQQSGSSLSTDNSYDQTVTWFNGCMLRAA